MKIIAIDPGYGRLGVAILERNNTNEELIYSDCFITSKSVAYPERLKLIGDKINQLINEYSPKACATETLFLTKNQKTAMLVAGARGVILYIAAQHNLPVYEYSPLQIKTAVTGYGKSDKKQVTMMVKQLITVTKDIKYDDEYDAIAIGLTCFATEKSFR